MYFPKNSLALYVVNTYKINNKHNCIYFLNKYFEYEMINENNNITFITKMKNYNNIFNIKNKIKYIESIDILTSDSNIEFTYMMLQNDKKIFSLYHVTTPEKFKQGDFLSDKLVTLLNQDLYKLLKHC